MSSQNQISIACSFQYGSKTIPYRLFQHERKNMRIEVSPSMEVFVKAPLGIHKDIIDKNLLKKALRITKQFVHFEQFYPKITPRKYISGETFFYLGKQYILKIETVTGKETVKIHKNHMIIQTKLKKSAKKILDKWYLENAKNKFPLYATSFLGIFQKKYNTAPKSIKIRAMKTRRGSCSKKGNITLNSELVKAPKGCIQYVIVHELCHLIEFNHTRAFYELQAKEMPDRQKQKIRLEKLLA